jgi:hypothetical protein
MRALCLVLLFAAASGFARTRDGLADALAARYLLGADTWARVVRIENTGSRGLEARSPYPPTTYALLFELSGILWFYCDEDGTQSLSLRRGTLDADKADPGPLLRAISPRFASWQWADGTGLQARAPRGQPPNDCLIECVAILRRRGAAPGSASLLFFYVDTPEGRLGHTVLVLEGRDGLTAVDPDMPGVSISIPTPASSSAQTIARFLRGGPVAAARELALEPIGIERPDEKWTALATPSLPAG